MKKTINTCGKKLILAAVVLGVLSCSTQGNLEEILSTEADLPQFLGCKALTARTLEFQFSRPVRVLSFALDSGPALESASGEETILVELSSDLPEAAKFTANLLVEDISGNTLEVLAPFRARNDRMPSLLITELRTEYTKPKVEFIEFRTLSAGNIGGIRVMIASSGLDAPVYEMPVVEVAAGEYVVLHLRTVDVEANGAIDETGQDLSLASATEANVNARDLWLPSNKELLRKSDAVYFLDQDDNVIDGVIFVETAEPWWSKDYLADAAMILSGKGAWTGETTPISPVDAVHSGTTTLTRTICRDEDRDDRNVKDDWYITANSGASPGMRNSTKRYTAKKK
jgi:hypothetical protein